ncbi:MAG: hypothetical protein Q4D79_02070 [Propionibacteriaceae bacterium]|nr:hypothetical protein [Propionibacteriaceae bacterium]
MSNFFLALEGAWHVLLAGLILGAGLPALFAVGIRALAMGPADAQGQHRPTWLGKVIAGFCFAVVLLGIIAGIGVIVAHGLGAQLTFDGLMPVFVRK